MSVKLTRNKKLMAYAAMAAAVPAGNVTGQVIYHDLDPDLIVENSFCYGCTDVEYIDMDMDGSDDFAIVMFYDYGLSGYLPTHSAYLMPLGSNKVAYAIDSSTVWNYDLGGYVLMTENVAQKLSFGDVVDTSYNFSTLNAVVRSYIEGYDEFTSPTFGQWAVNQTAYAGVQLMIDGEPHYGWIKLTHAHPGFDWQLSALEYAYQATAETSLVVGEIPVSCDPPVLSSVITLPGSMKLFFEPEAEASQYKLRYRQAGVFEPWNKMNKPLPVFKLTGLECATTYEFQVGSVCLDDGTPVFGGWSELAYETSGDCRIGSVVDELLLYPVPAGTDLHIESPAVISHLFLYAADGRMISSSAPDVNNCTLDVQMLQPGVYLLHLITAEEVLWREFTVE